MPIKYELITTILCRSIRFTQYYGSLSFSLSGLLSHSHWQTRTQNLFFFLFQLHEFYDFYSLSFAANWTHYTPYCAAFAAAASAHICFGICMLYLTENRRIDDRNSVHFSDRDNNKM